MSFVIFDTEYTTWPGCQEKGWSGNQKKEIVQIGALKISDQLEVTEELNILCRPVINPILSDYFIELTHITNERVQKQGIPFPTAYQKFESFVGNDVCYSHSWGSEYLNKSDGNIMDENILLNNMSVLKKITYRNIAFIFAELYKNNGIKIQKQCSGEIVKLLGIEDRVKRLNLDTHNALYDVYSILEGLKFFMPESIRLIKQLK